MQLENLDGAIVHLLVVGVAQDVQVAVYEVLWVGVVAIEAAEDEYLLLHEVQELPPQLFPRHLPIIIDQVLHIRLLWLLQLRRYEQARAYEVVELALDHRPVAHLADEVVEDVQRHVQCVVVVFPHLVNLNEELDRLAPVGLRDSIVAFFLFPTFEFLK